MRISILMGKISQLFYFLLYVVQDLGEQGKYFVQKKHVRVARLQNSQAMYYHCKRTLDILSTDTIQLTPNKKQHFRYVYNTPLSTQDLFFLF